MIVDNHPDKSDQRNLIISILPQKEDEMFTELVLFFEDLRKSVEISSGIDEKKKNQIEGERARIQTFLTDVCEKECQ